MFTEHTTREKSLVLPDPFGLTALNKNVYPGGSDFHGWGNIDEPSRVYKVASISSVKSRALDAAKGM